MRVLLTGGAGFVASHIGDRLVDRGDTVAVLDDLSTGNEANLPRGATLLPCDIADDTQVRRLATGPFDAVVHAAAEARVVVSVADPARSERINVRGTANVIDAARRVGSRRLVFISTGGAIYGETPTCATEETEARPVSPYGKDKLRAEGLVRASGLSHAILRLANVYGPRQRGDLEAGVIAIFLQRYRERSELVVYGDGSAERDYVYVSDIADAVLAALDATPSGTWNVGTGVATSVNALIEHFRRALGDPPVGVRYAPAREGELQRACLDAAKAASELGWRARHSLADGLGRLLAAV